MLDCLSDTKLIQHSYGKLVRKKGRKGGGGVRGWGWGVEFETCF